MSEFQGEENYILINLETLFSRVPQPRLVSEKIARFYELTPGCTVRRPLAIDVELAVIRHTFGTEVKGELKNQEETQ